MSVRGGVDGLVVKIEPESFAIPPQSGECDRVESIETKCEFVALVGGVVLAQPLVEGTHQAPDFGRFGIDVDRPPEAPFGVLELLAAQGLPGKDQVGQMSPRECPSEEAVNDPIGAASGRPINSYFCHVRNPQVESDRRYTGLHLPRQSEAYCVHMNRSARSRNVLDKGPRPSGLRHLDAANDPIAADRTITNSVTILDRSDVTVRPSIDHSGRSFGGG